MKARWLLEEDTFEENLEDLQKAITAQGMECKMAKYVPFDGMSFSKTYLASLEDCIISYGSLGMIKQVTKKTCWVPGAWCNLDHFKCSYYYPRLAKYLLNDRYFMLPYGELLRQKENLFRALNPDGLELFMRPDSGYKTFTGKVIERNEEEYRKDIEFFGFYDVEPEALVIVAEPKQIKEEWRLVVVNQQVITSSQYKDSGKVCVREGCPQEVLDLGNEIAAVWQPDRCFVIDICRTKDELKLVEINSLSCSGLYACDKMKFVEAVSAAAIEEWEEYHEC